MPVVNNQWLQRPDPLRPQLNYLLQLQRPAAALNLRSGYPRALMAGAHLSRFHGRGIEFDEVRPYQPGDDIRSMDWRVTARTGKPHTKLFREERERPVILSMDLRPAMFFATRGALKAVVASECAALLAWSVIHQGDRVGSLIFDGETHQFTRPTRGKRAALRLLGNVVQHERWKTRPNVLDEAFITTLRRAKHLSRTGSLMIFISDGRGLDQSCETLFKQLLQHHDILFVFIYDPFEREMPEIGRVRCSDGTVDHDINTTEERTRQEHTERFESRLQRLTSLTHLPGFFLVQCATNDDPLHQLQKVLAC
ncbi:MAG: DUF58 domain-containing protein [Mariprofundaceae bacterium]